MVRHRARSGFHDRLICSRIPTGFAEVLPGGIVLGGVMLVAMFYFAIAISFMLDVWLPMCFWLRFPKTFRSLSFQPQLPSDDNILSDIPGLVPPPQPAG